MTPATKTEWRKLRDLAKRPADIRQLFADNPHRAKQWALEGGGLLLDSAKAQADDNALAALNQLARAAQVCEKLNAQAQGEKINFTENRPALHSALRSRPAPADADPPPPPLRRGFPPLRFPPPPPPPSFANSTAPSGSPRTSAMEKSSRKTDNRSPKSSTSESAGRTSDPNSCATPSPPPPPPLPKRPARNPLRRQRRPGRARRRAQRNPAR